LWKTNGKTTTLLLFLDSLFPKPYIHIHICKMLPLETKQSGGKLLPHSNCRGGVGVGGLFLEEYIQHQALQEEGLQRKEEGTAFLQDWNLECKNFEWRRQIGKFEKVNAEERGVYCRCH
jgi:hypothetical protein